MNNRVLLVFLITIIPGVLFAKDYQCSIGDLQRRVEILYEAGGSVPCEVHYYKDTEAGRERQVLWRALNEEGYCERKASEFISKLEEMGWTCKQRVAVGQTPVAGSEDDTDTLMPGEDAESDHEF